MDRRLHRATARVAHASLAGQTDLPLTKGEPAALAVPLADLLHAPGGARERQLLLGEGFCILDRDQGHSFGFAHRDGYCGWLRDGDLGPPVTATHWVATPGTHLYSGPKVQSPTLAALSMGAQVQVLDLGGAWAQTPLGYVPAVHLRPHGRVLDDPVAVAEQFLGTPYLWGGNARSGLDCSGLVQVAHRACGIVLPGDSDLQETAGTALTAKAALRRGDLLFWSGHVAIVVDGAQLIHANGHTMSVAYEDIGDCIARIAAQGGGGVTQRRRI